MARVKLFINGVTKTLLEADLEKSGERAIDQIKITLPANVSVVFIVNILYFLDFIYLGNLIAL